MTITGKATALPVPERKQLADQIEAMGLASGGTDFTIGKKNRRYFVRWTTKGEVINVTELTPL